MKLFALVAIVLLAASMASADTVTQQYTAGDWLTVTRTIVNAGNPACLDSQGITDACASGGAIQPNEGTTGPAATHVTLSATNNGPVTRTGVGLTEDISYVPAGAQVTFTPSPSSSSGRTVTWTLPTMASGETDTFSYDISARVSPISLSGIPDVGVSADSATLSLSAPETVNSGERANITVVSPSGTPIPDAVVLVTYPDGIKHSVRTDATGTAKFTAQDPGTYTYSVDGYSLAAPVSTSVAPAQPAVPAAPVAAAQDTGFASSIIGALPYLAAVFAIAVIAFILYSFFTSRREEEAAASGTPAYAPQTGEEGGMSYTQKFSFAGDTGEPDEKKMHERTHDLVESRKRRLSAVVETPAEDQGTAQEEPGGASTEQTASDEDMAQILSELEHKARTTGEVASEQEEVERTIVELESIRDKLRAMRAKGKGAEAAGGEPEEASEDESPAEEETEEPQEEEKEASEPKAQEGEEPEEEEAEPVKATAKYKPAPRKIVYEKRVQPKVKPVAKGKKMRFGNKGVKKK